MAALCILSWSVTSLSITYVYLGSLSAMLDELKMMRDFGYVVLCQAKLVCHLSPIQG